MIDSALHAAAEILSAASSTLVLSGAGLSAESGLGTFRGAGGMWRDRKATDLATPEAFARDPALVWEFYSWRREAAFAAQPNAGHQTLVAWERAAAAQSFLHLTQNVDGLILAAGSEATIEIHGSLRRVRCSAACEFIQDDLRVPFPHPSACPQCSSALRPAVVWFGESLEAEHLDRAFAFAQSAAAVLVVGTSGQVQPAASIAQHAAACGARMIDVNPQASALSGQADVHLEGAAGEVLPALKALIDAAGP